MHGQSLPSAGSLLFVAGCFPLLLFADTCWLPQFACVLHAACYRPLAIALRVASCRVSFADCCLLPSVHCWLHVVGFLLLVVASCTFRF